MHWTELGITQMAHFSTRSRSEFPPRVQDLIDERATALREPVVGITKDGTVREGLFSLCPTGISSAAIIHTVLRTSNGGDYGHDLLRQHHDRFDHTTGEHVAREPK